TTTTRTDLGGGNTPAYQTTLKVFDGLGQLIQAQAPGDPGNVLVTNNHYNAYGKPDKTTLPRQVAGSPAVFLASDWSGYGSQAGTSTTYDAAGQPVMQTNPDNTSSTSMYAASTAGAFVTQLDANGHRLLNR